MNDIKNYCIKNFKDDYKSLNDIDTSNFYFKDDVTKKHLNNLYELFYELIDSINCDDDIINLFKISVDNKKLNKNNDIKISSISTAPYYLCCNLKSCDNSHICYGAKNERFKNILKYRLSNYVYFLILEYLYITDYDKYVKILCKSIDKNADLLSPIMRINQQSDIKNNTILSILNDMLVYIQHFYIKGCVFYTYSKTQNLNKNNISSDFIINDSIPIIFNASDLLAYDGCHNIFITIDKSISLDDIKKLGIKYYMCRGDCGGCHNCFKTNNHITLCYKH